MECIAARLHNAQTDNPTSPVSGQTYVPGRLRVEAIENQWAAPLDRIDLAVYEIRVNMNGELDDTCAPTTTLDDFLRAGVDFDITGDGTGDIEGGFDLPQ